MINNIFAVICTVVLYVGGNNKSSFKSVEEACANLHTYQEDVVIKIGPGFYKIDDEFVLNNVNNVSFESLDKNHPATLSKAVEIKKDMIVDSEEIPIVCYDDEFATLARWPNKGFEKFKETDDETYFKYTCSKFNKIDFEKENVYVCGYLAAEWQFDVRRIKSYKNSIVQIDNMPKSPTEWKGNGRGRFYICNLKSELDYPGEYYWNPNTKIVSFVKPKKKINKFVTCLDRKSIMTLNNCSNVVFKNIIFQYCKLHGVRLSSCKKCKIDSCTFKTIRECGVMVIGGNSCVITNSSIYNIGSGGIVMTKCGDRKKLISCNHVIANCKLDRIGFSTCKFPGCISVNGVGITVKNNVLSNCCRTGINVVGNDHLFENNEIYNMMLESRDGGAFYAGGDPLSRGNVYRYNYIHDINGVGVYLDDCDAGDSVISNRIVNVRHGVLIGCGQDNHIIGNTFEKCRCGVGVDDRGLTWMKWLKKIMVWKLKELPYRSKKWMDKYPNLKSYETHDPCEPIHIDIISNKFRKCGTEIGLGAEVKKYMSLINIKNNQ